MGYHPLGIDEWRFMLGALGWFYLQRVEMVDQDRALATQYSIARTTADEFLINDEMLFRVEHRSPQHGCERAEGLRDRFKQGKVRHR